MAVVNILMPTYKPQQKHLHAAIDSVLAQTYENWSLVICDEPTDTDTESLLSDYLSDSRITYHRNERRLGIGGNWNRCLEKGDAPYVQYMFQDDVWNSRYLQSAVNIMEDHEDVGMVSLGHEYVFEGDIPTKNSYQELKDFLAYNVSEGKKEGLEFLLWWMEHGLHPNVIGEPMFVMLRRSVMDTVGLFREDMHQNLDSEYWARMLIHTNWYYLPGNFGTFRVHSAAASMQNYEHGRGMFDRLRMINSIGLQLPVKHQEQARKIMQQQLKGMTVKFMERYGGYRVSSSAMPNSTIVETPCQGVSTSNHNVFSSYKDVSTSLFWFVLKHWWVIIKSIVCFTLKTVRK